MAIRRKILNPTLCSSNDSAAYAINIDVRPSMDAMLNAAGWPANEITLLMKLQSDDPDSALARSLENSLIEIPHARVDNSGKSDRDLINGIIPKHVQTLGEYMKYLDSLPLSDTERSLLEERAKREFVEPDKSDDKSDGDGVVE